MQPEFCATANKPDYLVSVASILHNDEAVVEQFVREAMEILRPRFRYFELTLIDNCSSDGTLARVSPLLRELPGIRLIRLSREQERETVLSALLDNCIGDFVVTLDCRADPVELIPEIVGMLTAACDVVIGQNRAPHASRLRRLLSGLSSRLAIATLKVQTVPNAGVCHGFTRRALNSITKIRSKSRHILYDSMVIGYQHSILPYAQRLRPGARVEVEPLLVTLGGRVQMIIANSLLPLRLAGLLGVVASMANLLYLLYILGVAIFKRHTAEGWITTSLLNTVMFFTVFLILAVLSEYLGRILEESRDRPTYFIESESSSSVSTCDQQRLNVISE